MLRASHKHQHRTDTTQLRSTRRVERTGHRCDTDAPCLRTGAKGRRRAVRERAVPVPCREKGRRGDGGAARARAVPEPCRGAGVARRAVTRRAAARRATMVRFHSFDAIHPDKKYELCLISRSAIADLRLAIVDRQSQTGKCRSAAQRSAAQRAAQRSAGKQRREAAQGSSAGKQRREAEQRSAAQRSAAQQRTKRTCVEPRRHAPRQQACASFPSLYGV